jgi:hypothetical protein
MRSEGAARVPNKRDMKVPIKMWGG